MVAETQQSGLSDQHRGERSGCSSGIIRREGGKINRFIIDWTVRDPHILSMGSVWSTRILIKIHQNMCPDEFVRLKAPVGKITTFTLVTSELSGDDGDKLVDLQKAGMDYQTINEKVTAVCHDLTAVGTTVTKSTTDPSVCHLSIVHGFVHADICIIPSAGKLPGSTAQPDDLSRSCRFDDLLTWTFIFSSPHRCSLGFKMRLCAGRSVPADHSHQQEIRRGARLK
ncbi:hypothetical protein AMECASPLE_024272, partial [Ameca splendens]